MYNVTKEVKSVDELEMLKEIDKMIDETQDLDRELEETGMSREALTAQAEELKSEYNALSSKLELTFAAEVGKIAQAEQYRQSRRCSTFEYVYFGLQLFWRRS